MLSGLIRFFREFLKENDTACQMYREMKLPEITEKLIDNCLNEIPIDVDKEYIKAFILNGQAVIQDIINSEDIDEDEEQSAGLIL